MEEPMENAEKGEQKPFDYKGLLQSIVVKRWKISTVIKYELEGEVPPQGKFRSQVVLYNKEDEEIRRFPFGNACDQKKNSQQSAAKLAMQELDGSDNPTNGTGTSDARSPLTHEPSSRDNNDAPSFSHQHTVDATTTSPVAGGRNARQYEFSNVFNPRVANVATGSGLSPTCTSPTGATKATSSSSEAHGGEEDLGNGHAVGLGTISAEYTDRMKQNKDWKGELQMLIVRKYKFDVEIKYGHIMKCNIPGGDDDNQTEHLSICILRHIDQDNVGTCIVMGTIHYPVDTIYRCILLIDRLY